MARDSQSFFRPSRASWKALGSSPKVCAPSSTVIVRQTMAMLIRVAAEIRFIRRALSDSGIVGQECPTYRLFEDGTQSLLILLVGVLIFGACATLALALFVF